MIQLTHLHPRLRALPLPSRMAQRLVVDARGAPVPWCVAWVQGQPDHRLVDTAKVTQALREGRCCLCGDPLGRHVSVVVGPSGVINRFSVEPPSHVECAVYAVQACPFLAQPQAVRHDHALPVGSRAPAGDMLRHHPRVSAIWTCRTFTLFPLDHGIGLDLGEPTAVQWWYAGHPASRAVCAAALETARTHLQAACASPQDRQQLRQALAQARRSLPQEGRIPHDPETTGPGTGALRPACPAPSPGHRR